MPNFQQFSDQHFSDDWVPYHAAMKPLRRNAAVAAATIGAVTAVATATSTIAATNYEQFIASITSPVAWSVAVIQSKVIDFVTYILTQPAALIGWTENQWAMLHDWLIHIAVALIDIMP